MDKDMREQTGKASHWDMMRRGIEREHTAAYF